MAYSRILAAAIRSARVRFDYQFSSEAAWNSGEACMQTHGGYSMAREYDIERKWRSARLQRIAPVLTNLILAFIGHNVLVMPKSY